MLKCIATIIYVKDMHYNYLHGLWNPEVQCRIHKGSPIIPILSRINPIPRIDTYLFKVHSNIVLQLRLGLPKGLFPVGLPVKILKELLPSSILATWPAHLNSRFKDPDYVRWTVQTMKFLIVEPSPLPILIPLGPKYSPQDPAFKYP